MAKKAQSKAKGRGQKAMNALVFIDTNILLDFYRYQSSTVSELLDLIEENIDVLVLTEQVEMEFKKNRQSVLQKWIAESKKTTAQEMNVNAPAYLLEDQAAKSLKKGVDGVRDSVTKLRKKVESAIEKPGADEVYKRLGRVFKHEGPYVLNRGKKERFRIRHQARTRFLLGYPPRKNDDLLIGDAVNWEWMVECAKASGKGLIIVTKDTDFGVEVGNKVHLNDWLLHEFRERTSAKRAIVITRRLTDAFKLLKKHVSAAAESAVNAVSTVVLSPITVHANATVRPSQEEVFARVLEILRNANQNVQRRLDEGSGESAD